MPTLHRLIHGDCKVTDADSAFIKKAKTAIASDLKKSYIKDQEELLFTITVIDPRFKNLQWVDYDEKIKAYDTVKRLATELLEEQPQPLLPIKVKQEPEDNLPSSPALNQLLPPDDPEPRTSCKKGQNRTGIRGWLL